MLLFSEIMAIALSIRPSARAKSVPNAVVHDMRELLAARRKAGLEAVDFLQGLVATPPPESASQVMRSLDFANPNLHALAPVPGLEDLREAIADYRSSAFDEPIGPENVIVTAGGNNAFFAVVSALTDVNDTVMLLSPYFFNHAMSLKTLSVGLVDCPMRPSEGFQPNAQSIRKAWERDTAGIVVTAPSNPSGTAISPDAMRGLRDVVSEKSGFLIVDESYLHFEYESDFRNPTAYSLKDTVLVGSFSKSLCIAGARVGYVIAHRELRDAVIRLQDTMVISASYIGQLMALASLKTVQQHVSALMPTLDMRRKLLTRRLREIPAFSDVHGDAAIFLFARLASELDSSVFARRTLQEQGVALVPGDAFGEAGKGWVRFAYGASDEAMITRGCDLLLG